MASTLDTGKLVDFSQPSLYKALASVLFNPIWWNLVAQNEHRNKSITRFVGGNPRMGCYLLAIAIFILGLFRDTLYTRALQDQPRYSLFSEPLATLVPASLFLTGQILVITSTYALGITGTFLGDYFGILLDHRVEGFPFNIIENPMYIGSTMCFAAGALWYERPMGLLITAVVYTVYTIALRFEGPFTEMIYASRPSSNSRQPDTAVKKEL